MATLQWRPRFIARNVLGKADMAARMATALPNYSEQVTDVLQVETA